jgi:phosphatidate cytidylyltransferase
LKDLSKRLLTAAWGIPSILVLSYLGGFYFLFLVLTINGIALWEFYSIYKHQNYHAYRRTGVVFSSVILLAAYWLNTEAMLALLVFIMVPILIRHMAIAEKTATMRTSLTITGIIYISGFLSMLLHLRLYFTNWLQILDTNNPAGRYFILLWLGIWICDTAAYFGGRFFGKHKLAPKTSPNKTIEGAVSGFIGAFLAFPLLGQLIVPEISVLYLWTTGLIIGIFGQMGDLIESRFKRDADVKDTSSLLSSHGGFLDRFDSVIFSSPFLFLLFHYVKF